MGFTQEDKKKLIEQFKLHKTDTGSPEVQVGLLTGSFEVCLTARAS